MFEKNMSEINFVVFDLETTGFKPIEEQIIEIGAVKINIKGEIIDRFQKFVKLYKKHEVPEKITELTTITTEELLEKGENIADVIISFEEFTKDSVLVAQNAKFDMSFLAGYYLENKRQTYSRVCFDTINFAKKIFENEESYRLAKLVELFDVDYDGDAHHRADYDAEVTAKILIKCLKKLNINEDTKVKDIILIEAVPLATMKQESFLNSLVEKKQVRFNSDELFTKFTASAHIDILLNLK